MAKKRRYRSRTNTEIAEIYAAIDGGMPIAKVEKKFGVKRGTVYLWRRQDAAAAANADPGVATPAPPRSPEQIERPEHPELAAVASIAKVMIAFDEVSRRRVFAAVLCLFEDDRASASLRGAS